MLLNLCRKKHRPLIIEKTWIPFIQDYMKIHKTKIRRNIMTKQWVCTVCNYVYDGDIPFEELPDDYVCPLCGVDKSYFEQREVD